jgi:hypothetical protein
LKVLSERRGRRLRFPRSERPHSPQHLKPGGLSALQFEQRFLSAPPQLPQKLVCSGFSEPQLEQRTCLSRCQPGVLSVTE